MGNDCYCTEQAQSLAFIRQFKIQVIDDDEIGKKININHNKK